MKIYPSVHVFTFYDSSNMNKIYYNLHYCDNIYLIRDNAANWLSIELLRETTPTAHPVEIVYVYGTVQSGIMFTKNLNWPLF
jgi:hypothetical protein